MLAFRHERFIREALQAAVRQTRQADEIIVIDDASPDTTTSLIATFIAENPNAPIRFLRNEINLGVSGSFARAVAMASGDILVMMSGDDVSMPNRVERCVSYLTTHPSAMALITDADIIDGDSLPRGILDNCAGMADSSALRLADLTSRVYFLRGRSSCGAAAAYRSEVFRFFSPIRSGLYAEDDPFAFRAMLIGTCDFLPERLLAWRRHGDNLSYAGGVRRGPEMATHYRRCEAMVDQMLMDAADWAYRNPEARGGGFENAVFDLHFRKHRWSLWSVAHEEGINLRGFLVAARGLLAHSPTIRIFAGEAWRPLVGLITPFPLQRLLARL